MEKFGNIELAKIIEKASAEDDAAYVLAMKKLSNNDEWGYLEFPGGVACYVGNSPYTGVHGFGTSEEEHTEELLVKIEEFYKSKGCSVILSVPSVASYNVFKLLFDKGYGTLGCRNTYIYDSREKIGKESKHPIDEASEGNGLDNWLQVVSEGFAGKALEEADDISKGQSIKEGNSFFLAKVNDEYAAASALYTNGEVARLGGMGTLVDFRGKGLQTEMIRHRVNHALEKRCKYIFSDTQPGNNSQRNLERNGFKLAYTRIIFRKLKN